MGKKEKRTEITDRLIAKTRKLGIDLLLIPMSDFHGSEYISDHFKLIRYLTGFTGSAATVIVCADSREVLLFTDGRYFLQAEKELRGSGIKLMKSGNPGVPTVKEYIAIKAATSELKQYCIGFDGRLLSAAYVKELVDCVKDRAGEGKIRLAADIDPLGEVWDEDEENIRPELPAEPIWELRKNFTGLERSKKLAALRMRMREQGADVLVVSALDEIAWLLNLRGNDVAYNPVFLAHALISETDVRLFLNTGDYPRRVITPMLFENDAVEAGGKIYAQPYSEFYKALKKIAKSRKRIWYDPETVSYLVQECSAQALSGGVSGPVTKPSPLRLMKAVKNPVEIDNERQAHIYDGVALTRLIYWLKEEVKSGREETDELQLAEKLVKLRAEQSSYLGESFAPIIAFAHHGAIVHYEADEKSRLKIEGNVNDKGARFLLMDTGAHYLEGTTDVTRTVVMGQAEPDEKRNYTAVLAGNLRLANAVFKEGTPGNRLDIIAREPLYRIGLDFNHGTGHGVGYLLNVHEGPASISIRGKNEHALMPGMICSDEPGVYLDGKYGIRLENLVCCRELYRNSFGSFMGFETLTLVPFDPDAVDFDMLDEKDRQLLADYHRRVRMTIGPLLPEKERAWLDDICRKFGAEG